MRVLHVIPSIASSRGGPTNMLFNLARTFVADGVDVEVIATRVDLDAAEEARARARLGNGLHLVSTIGPARLDFAPAFLPRFIDRVRAVDLVHIHTVFTYPVAIAPVVCRAIGKPYIIRTVGTLDDTCIASRSTRQKQLMLSMVGRANLIGAGAVQVTSELEATQVTALVPEARVRLVEIGVTELGAAAESTGIGTRVGYLGRLHPIKNVEVLLRAMAELPTRVELIVAGAGEPRYEASLRELADELGIAKRIRWLGHVDDTAKRSFFAECDVLAFPSSHESFGIAVVEAMAARRAVVVSPEVGIANEIERAGAGVVAAAAVRFARALGALLDDGGLRAKRAAAGRALSMNRWSWDTIAKNTLAMYDEVLARSRD